VSEEAREARKKTDRRRPRLRVRFTRRPMRARRRVAVKERRVVAVAIVAGRCRRGDVECRRERNGVCGLACSSSSAIPGEEVLVLEGRGRAEMTGMARSRIAMPIQRGNQRRALMLAEARAGPN